MIAFDGFDSHCPRDKLTTKTMTPKEKASELFIDCYPLFYDNGRFGRMCVSKDYCRNIANAIIKETLEEYTNDEGHERVEYWRQVLVEIDNLKGD